MDRSSVKIYARRAVGPLGWMLLALALYIGAQHYRDHGAFHTMIRWVNKADQELIALKKQQQGLAKTLEQLTGAAAVAK